MLKDPKSAPSTETTKTPVEGEVAVSLQGLKPWEDQTLSPVERFDSYKAFVEETLKGIASAFDRAKETQDLATQKEIMNSPETKKWMEEGAWLRRASAKELCERIDRTEAMKLLGKNFLGAEAWKEQGIDVGEVPPLPQGITKLLLESDCPFHPGEKIKDTHLLVLIPKTVNGEPYSALKLEELCATRSGSGDRFISIGQGWIAWKSKEWASAPQAESEWILLPKSDPDPSKVREEKHFRSKDVAEQQKVHDDHYKEYREVKTLEFVTAALLNDMVNGLPRMVGGWEYLRCVEPNASAGRVCVGYFDDNGLRITANHIGDANATVGRALAWKS